MFFSKRNRIIKKAVKKTISEFARRTPKIYKHFFYGAVDIKPQHLVIWYLFETDAELEAAKSSGYCDELEKATIQNLISLGYPEEAFVLTYQEVPMDKIKIRGGTEADRNKLLESLTHIKATIEFTTKEDVDNKANGNYYLYFK